jgi:hypothetical protein
LSCARRRADLRNSGTISQGWSRTRPSCLAAIQRKHKPRRFVGDFAKTEISE